MPLPLPERIRKHKGCPPGYFLVTTGVTQPGDIYINCFNEWAPSMHPGTPIARNNWTQYARLRKPLSAKTPKQPIRSAKIPKNK